MVVKHTPGDVDLESIINELSSKRVKVGYFETARYPDGTPVAGIAAVQEFGSEKRNIPARPFFRPALRDNKQKHKDGMAAAFRRAVKGNQTATTGLNQLGEAVVGDIVDSIKSVTSPPLSQSTIARKGFAKPLIDTALMMQSTTYAVEDK